MTKDTLETKEILRRIASKNKGIIPSLKKSHYCAGGSDSLVTYH